MRTLESKTVDGTKLEIRKLSDGRYSILEDGSRIIEPFSDKDDAFRYYQNTIADFRRRANDSGGFGMSLGGGGGSPQMPDFSGGAGGMPMLPGFGMGQKDDDDDDDERGFYIPGL